jgi:MFS family permease
MFLFGARDIWFVVALPVFLTTQFAWDHWYVGGFLATWVIGYGIVQSLAPKITGKNRGVMPDGRHATAWALGLSITPALIALSLTYNWHVETLLIGGLLAFGALFAVNSALHSYLIVSYASEDRVSLDVGFYYMANAMGRLIGTVLSGWIYQDFGLAACLWLSTLFILLAALISQGLPKHPRAKLHASSL